MSEKRLRIGFEPTAAPTSDVHWMEVAAILKRRTTLNIQLYVR